jgi:hypothetical protein
VERIGRTVEILGRAAFDALAALVFSPIFQVGR